MNKIRKTSVTSEDWCIQEIKTKNHLRRRRVIASNFAWFRWRVILVAIFSSDEFLIKTMKMKRVRISGWMDSDSLHLVIIASDKNDVFKNQLFCLGINWFIHSFRACRYSLFRINNNLCLEWTLSPLPTNEKVKAILIAVVLNVLENMELYW